MKPVTPLFTDHDFADVMDRLGPWEQGPLLAVAVSGGRDSMALTLLADGWARALGGRVVGLTVDHGLRPEAAEEARTVGGWLAARGVEHRTLVWRGKKPINGVQEAAREARYGLLRGYCVDHGILHLLLAHHREDQAETLLQRLVRGSGVDGLSAMSPLTFWPELRLLRPLLEVPRAALEALLRAEGQDWIEDPSNQSEHYQRSRLRRFLAEEGLEAGRLTATARQMGRARHALEQAAADVMARAVALDPAGFAWLDPALLADVPDETALRLVAGLCRTVGDAIYPPRLDKLERLLGELRAGLGGRRSFGGCLLAPKRGRVLVMREPARMAGPLAVRAGQRVLWDNRFTVTLGGAGEGWVQALGAAGWADVRRKLSNPPVPSSVCPTLPALVDASGVSAVPQLGYNREEMRGLTMEQVIFSPSVPLMGVFHCLV